MALATGLPVARKQRFNVVFQETRDDTASASSFYPHTRYDKDVCIIPLLLADYTKEEPDRKGDDKEGI